MFDETGGRRSTRIASSGRRFPRTAVGGPRPAMSIAPGRRFFLYSSSQTISTVSLEVTSSGSRSGATIESTDAQALML